MYGVKNKQCHKVVNYYFLFCFMCFLCGCVCTVVRCFEPVIPHIHFSPHSLSLSSTCHPPPLPIFKTFSP